MQERMDESGKQQNIILSYCLLFISGVSFPITSWLFFYLQYLDFKHIAVLTGLGALAGVLLQVPTGAFADLVGRKKAVIFSFLLSIVAELGIAYSTTFFSFLIFTLVGSLSLALFSGSLEALVYDSLKQHVDTLSYDHVVSRLEALNWIGLFSGSLLGGFMYFISPRLPYLAQGGLNLIAIPLTFLLIESQAHQVTHTWSSFIRQNTSGFRELFCNLQTTQKTLFFTIIGVGYYVAATILGISQAKEYGLDARGVGVLFALGYIASAIVSIFFPTIKKKLGQNFLLGLTVTALISSFLLAKFVGLLLGLVLITLRIASSTTFRNTRSVVFNSLISSQNRATALSTLILLAELPYILLSYFIGDTIDKTSPNTLALWLGIVLIILIGLEQVGVLCVSHLQKFSKKT